MENSNVLWNIIGDWLDRVGLSYISEFEAMLILLAAFLILLFLMWFFFRRARLWYWKTNIQIDTLKSIDVHLKGVEEKLNMIKMTGKSDGEIQTQNDETEPPTQDAIPETVVLEEKGLTFIGKSGRVYTEAELELQIRD